MKDEQYSLAELAERVGIEPRTIRWYISEGLLRGPEALGRNAYYTEYHLKRLRAIKTLKETYGLPIAEIRRHVLLAGGKELHAAAGPPQDQLAPVRNRAKWRRDQTRQARAEEAAEPPESAECMVLFEEAGEPAASDSPDGPLADLLEALRSALGERRVARQTRAREALRLPVTPDITLEIAGRLSPEEIALFEQLADYLREMLLGGGADTEP